MKLYKKITAAVLAAVLCCTPMFVSNRADFKLGAVDIFADDAPKLDSTGYYNIENADQLYWFADHFLNNTVSSYNIRLVNDIVVNEGTMTNKSTGARKWVPIGGDGMSNTSRYAFRGVVDGGGHTISGLYCVDVNSAGLVGFNHGVVKNLGIINSYFYSEATSTAEEAYSGTLVGYNGTDGVIQDCYSFNNLVNGTYLSGGITGALDSGAVVKNCYGNNTVTSRILRQAGFQTYVDAIGYKFNGSTVENAYYNENKIQSYDKGALSYTDVQQNSGELAYLLNNSGARDVWRQNIDSGTPDDHPVLDTTHGKVYLKNGRYTNGDSAPTETTKEQTTEITTEAPTQAPAGNEFPYGAANAENSLSASDAAMILQKVLDEKTVMPIEKKTNDYFKYVDVDGDKQLTASDASLVMQKVLDERVKFPVEK